MLLNVGSSEQLIEFLTKLGVLPLKKLFYTLLILYTYKCMPILLYGLEALPLNKSQPSSLDFMVNRFLVKQFNSNDNVNNGVLRSAVQF